MKFDLAQFKKTASDKHSTTLTHPVGHSIKVAHAPLHPKMREKLAALPMAEGGMAHYAEGTNQLIAPPHPVAEQNRQARAGGLAIDSSGKGIQDSQPTREPASQSPQSNAEGGPVRKMYAKGGDADSSNAPVVINVGNGQAPTPQVSPEQFAANAANVSKSKNEAEAGAKPYGTGDVMMGSGEPMPMAPVQSQPQQVIQPQAATPQEQAQKAPASAMSDNSPSPQPAPPAPEKPDPFGNVAGSEAYGQGLASQLGGLSQEATAQGQLGGTEAKIAQRQAATDRAISNTFQASMADIMPKMQAAFEAYKQGTINPNHYQENQSVGSKIGTAIGLIGAGFGGPQNVQRAVDNINRQIDRDVNAQMVNQNTKQNVFTGFLQQMGNARDAALMSSALNSNIYADQLKQAASSMQDPIAKARLLQASGQLMQQASDRLGQYSMLKSLQQGANSGILPPERLIQFTPLLAPAQREPAFKQLQEAQNASSLRDNTLAAFDQLAKVNTLANKTMNPIQSRKQIAALKNATLDKLTKDTSGRVTPETVKLIGSAFDTAWTNPETLAVQRHAVNNLVSQGMNYPLIKAAGIDVNNLGRYDLNGQPRIKVSPPQR